MLDIAEEIYGNNQNEDKGVGPSGRSWTRPNSWPWQLSWLAIIPLKSSRSPKEIYQFTFQHSFLIPLALYLGDMEELANLLSESGHNDLSEVCKSTYGIGEVKSDNEKSKFMVPPYPINRLEGDELNWPLEVLLIDRHDNVNYDKMADELEDLTIGPDLEQFGVLNDKQLDDWDQICEDELGLNNKTTQSILDSIKEGNFIDALSQLKQIYGNVDGNILQDTFTKIQQSNETINGIDVITQHLEQGYNHVTNGNFDLAKLEFRTTLTYCMAYIQKYPDELVDYIDICRVYILAVLLESERSRCADIDIKRSLELASYFTCCDMKVQHRYLALRRAVGILWKAQNYNTAALLVTRLLNLNIEGAQEEMDKAKRIYTLCEQKGTDAYEIDFNTNDDCNIKLCTISFTKINNQNFVKCPFCQSIALANNHGKSCNICQLCNLI